MPVDPALYQSTIPQSTDQLSKSQGDLLNNFGAIMSLIDQDHVDFAAGTGNAGKHKQVTFPVQSPAPTFTGGDLGLYSFLSPTTAINELYINKLNAASVNYQVQMTSSILSINAAPVYNAPGNGWSYLPSGILIKWGFVSPSIPNPVTVTYPTAATIPVFNAVLCVQVTPWTNLAGDPNIAATLFGPPTATNFQLWTSPRTTTGTTAIQLFYLAVGY